ncbi:MAG: NADH:flavin oxidoreductase/NADH oxidase family protein [Panacagrimonas sp.]
MIALLREPLHLPCGATLSNRLCKAAMTEGIADEHLRATSRHETLYRRWSEGGAGLLLTGNVQIDRRVLERPGNVTIDVTDPITTDAEARARLIRWTKAGTVGGNHLWMQINHAGRQSPRYVTTQPLAPSAEQLGLLGNFARPRALTEDEILDLVQRFAKVAVIARETGFTGVQIHAAHGYLLSSFLSPVTNRRGDAWGGSLENRARALIETVRATRKAVGMDFPVGIKLNSDDFRRGGFSNDDCIQVVRWLNDESVDLLEISGGTYEQPVLIGHAGDAGTAVPKRASTRQREAYFIDYAERIRAVAKMPMMVTGGFRTREGMESVLSEGACDVIGIARPLCTHTDVAGALLRGEIRELPAFERSLQLAAGGLFSPASSVMLFKMINIFGALGWYYLNLFRLADGLGPDLQRGPLSAFFAYTASEYRSAWRMHRARRKRTRDARPAALTQRIP